MFFFALGLRKKRRTPDSALFNSTARNITQCRRDFICRTDVILHRRVALLKKITIKLQCKYNSAQFSVSIGRCAMAQMCGGRVNKTVLTRMTPIAMLIIPRFNICGKKARE